VESLVLQQALAHLHLHLPQLALVHQPALQRPAHQLPRPVHQLPRPVHQRQRPVLVRVLLQVPVHQHQPALLLLQLVPQLLAQVLVRLYNMSNLLKTNTTVSDLIGKFQMGATRPTGENDVVGLEAGDAFIKTTTKKL